MIPPAAVPIATAFLVDTWLEALLYGFLLCLFLASIWTHLYMRKASDGHSQVMFYCGSFMFFIATFHLTLNIYRLIQGFVTNADNADIGGPVGWISALSPWDHVLKDTLYATQEIFGDMVACYRVYIIFGRSWLAVAVPLCLLIVEMISGYAVIGIYPSEKTGATVFDPNLLKWITIFYAVAVAISTLTTGMMVWRLWKTEQRSAAYRTTGAGSLTPVVRILIESAALQWLTEVILLILYSTNNVYQYVLLEAVTPIVGITFCMLGIRIAMRSKEFGSIQTGASMQLSTTTATATINTLPPNLVNVTTKVENYSDNSYQPRIIHDRHGQSFLHVV